MHPAVGFLGQDAEQQRLGQAGLLVLGPHQEAHLLVVLPAGDQLRAHPGQPLGHGRAHRLVELDHLAQVAAAQHRHRTLGRGHGAEHRRGLVGRADAVGGGAEALAAARHARALLHQGVVGGQEARRVATARVAAAARSVQQRCGGFTDGLATLHRLAAAELRQALAEPVAGGFKLVVELLGVGRHAAGFGGGGQRQGGAKDQQE